MLVVLAVMFALFMWWFSTGAILMLVRMRRAAHGLAMVGMTVLAFGALIGLSATNGDAGPAGAFAGFCYGLLIWAWLEMSFLFGFITGPRKSECPPAIGEGERFRLAFQTIAWHELAILAAGVLVIVLTYGAENQVATWTFLTLWIMRISAKLNIFYGAPHVTEEFLPGHLRHLASYFRRGRVSRFFPFSVTAASLVFGVLVHSAASTSDAFDVIALTLVASLLGLAIIEHWFLVLPIPDAALWRWAVSDETGGADRPRAVAEPNAQPARSPVKTLARLP